MYIFLVKSKHVFQVADFLEQCVEKLEEIARSARETEPGSSKYAILVPREDDDDNNNNDTGGKGSNRIWVLEEYDTPPLIPPT